MEMHVLRRKYGVQNFGVRWVNINERADFPSWCPPPPLQLIQSQQVTHCSGRGKVLQIICSASLFCRTTLEFSNRSDRTKYFYAKCRMTTQKKHKNAQRRNNRVMPIN
jgi:hypothetical protein